MKSILSIALLFLLTWPVPQTEAARLKDLAAVKGVRGNQLFGYGLVVGLNGTGDGNKAAFTTQGMVNMLQNMGMQVNENDIKVKNVAGVLITADLPPFIKAGQTIDVTLSSLGDASSLQGGTLVATPLKGLDDEIYAMAQGAVSIGGFKTQGAQTDGSQENHLTVARIPAGATVEREVPVTFAGKNLITLNLHAPDFTTVSRMTETVNQFLDGPYASAKDGGTVTVTIPEKFHNQEILFLAALEKLEITPDAIARVVVDERTGTIVMGENVTINNLALTHGSLTIQISDKPEPPIATELIGQILTDEMVKKMVASITGPTGAPQKNKIINLNTGGATLGEVVRALNSIGAAPRDLIAIFQAIKAAGAMQAELKII